MEVTGKRSEIARLYLDVLLDSPPFYPEMDYSPDGDLTRWAESKGGIAEVPLETCLDIVAQVADALAAAHYVGVIHKDVEPSDILIQ